MAGRIRIPDRIRPAAHSRWWSESEVGFVTSPQGQTRRRPLEKGGPSDLRSWLEGGGGGRAAQGGGPLITGLPAQSARDRTVAESPWLADGVARSCWTPASCGGFRSTFAGARSSGTAGVALSRWLSRSSLRTARRYSRSCAHCPVTSGWICGGDRLSPGIDVLFDDVGLGLSEKREVARRAREGGFSREFGVWTATSGRGESALSRRAGTG